MTDSNIGERAAIPKSDEWAERIAAQQGSGISVKQFCKEQGLTEYSFYAWRKRLRKREAVRFALVDRGAARQEPAISSHAGSAHERQGSAQSSRQQTPSSMQSSHQQYASSAQASREQTATGMQSSAQQYHGSYPHAASPYPAWDAGAGLAAATTGAAIGVAAASSKSSPPAQVYVASPPCAAPAVIPVGSMQYFKCGSSWYTQGYGPNGPTFVVVAPPPGF